MKEFIYILRPTRLGMLTEGSTPEAAQIMQNDPAILNSVLRATLYPFRIALRS
jgi:hypothetical protein